MNNLIFEINEKHYKFIELNSCAPDFLYLGSIAYHAFIQTMGTEAQEKPYMGMKVFHIINNSNHIGCG